jgi:hypothetical protein
MKGFATINNCCIGSSVKKVIIPLTDGTNLIVVLESNKFKVSKKKGGISKKAKVVDVSEKMVPAALEYVKAKKRSSCSRPPGLNFSGLNNDLIELFNSV